MMRAIVAWLLLVALPPVAVAQTPRATSGILLGVNTCPYSSCALFNTYWIVREGDRVRIAAQGKGLAVPRRDGFWWVGVEAGSSITTRPDTAECPDSTAEDPDAPMSNTTEIPIVPSVIWAAPASTRDARRAPSGGYGEIAIDWVNGDWVAITERTMASDQEHSTTSRYILPLDGVARGDSAIGESAFSAAGPRFARAIESCMAGTDERAGSLQWQVLRRMTYWEVAGAFRSYGDMDEPGSQCRLPRELAAAVIGPDRVTVPWSAIKSVLPGATIAFESPAADLLVVLQDSVWYAFFPKGRAPGGIVARFRIAGAPVMAQWAIGAHASRWTTELTALLSAGTPVPR